MAKKKKKKELNLNEMDADDLNRELVKSKEELFKLKFRSSAAPVKNTMEIRSLKRNVARMLTFINQKRKTNV